jgi:protein-S-isoprenylcysteine O-methyltransferase Ste14
VLQRTGTISPMVALDTTALRVGGLLLAIARIVGVLAAQHTIGTSWRVGVDQHSVAAVQRWGR